jgi:hypothetical protein
VTFIKDIVTFKQIFKILTDSLPGTRLLAFFILVIENHLIYLAFHANVNLSTIWCINDWYSEVDDVTDTVNDHVAGDVEDGIQ